MSVIFLQEDIHIPILCHVEDGMTLLSPYIESLWQCSNIPTIRLCWKWAPMERKASSEFRHVWPECWGPVHWATSKNEPIRRWAILSKSPLSWHLVGKQRVCWFWWKKNLLKKCSFLDNSRRKDSFSFKTRIRNALVGGKQKKCFAFEQLSDSNSNVKIFSKRFLR